MVAHDAVVFGAFNSKFWKLYPECCSGFINAFIHVVYTQMFAAQAQELTGTACDFNLAGVWIYKANGVANHIAPSASAGGDKNGIVNIGFYICQWNCFGAGE